MTGANADALLRGEIHTSETFSRRALLVDLNNFARFPTISIGYLAAVCRRAGMEVSIFSPLSAGLSGVERERPVPWYGLIFERLNFRFATSRSAVLRGMRKRLARVRHSTLQRRLEATLVAFKAALDNERPDVVLVSTYLMYRSHTVQICRLCKENGIPVIIGGPYFADKRVAEDWASIEGATALINGEVELELPQILNSIYVGSLPKGTAGLWLRNEDGKLGGAPRRPLIDLDAVPFPDYRDFPWQRYPNQIIPIITGRGCGWGVCRFCSDVTSTAGRTFRSRTEDNVLAEIKQHYEEYGAKLFVFTDLKLNSNLRVWNAILYRMQDVAPGSRWIAAVHVDAMGRRANGLSQGELTQAYTSGCVRLTTGLESGSQYVLDLMKKGTTIEATSQFLAHAHGAGISTRCTMIVGFPGERAEHIAQSADFLRLHKSHVERVALNRFQIMTGTKIHMLLEKRPHLLPDIEIIETDHAHAQISLTIKRMILAHMGEQ